MPSTAYPIQRLDSYRYIDEGPPSGPPVVLLHGMLGDLSNWTDTIRALAGGGYRVLVPVLPVYDLPLKQTRVSVLKTYTRHFNDALQLERPILVGNSLGGQVALLYALAHPADVPALVLSGASGIYEVTIGTTTPRRYDPEYVRERAAATFYDPRHATGELVDEMLAIVQDRERAVRLIKMARSQQEETVTARLGEVQAPALLVWGRNDQITPPDVAVEFSERLPNAELHFIDRCGHAPMIEHPDAFNEIVLDFLHRVAGKASVISSSKAS